MLECSPCSSLWFVNGVILECTGNGNLSFLFPDSCHLSCVGTCLSGLCHLWGGSTEKGPSVLILAGRVLQSEKKKWAGLKIVGLSFLLFQKVLLIIGGKVEVPHFRTAF